MSAFEAPLDLLQLTAGIVAAHIGHNPVPATALPEVIRSVYDALSRVGSVPPPTAKPEPAVPAKKSVFPDHLICLEDGKKLKMLKRHLETAYGMTPKEYREKWGLPDDYPMVAPEYAARRSTLAKQIGLGRKPAPAAPQPLVKRIPEGVSGKRKGNRGRPRES